LIEQTRASLDPDLADKIEFIPCLERGAVRPVIAEQVSALNADILIMGTIARTGVPGFIIGNTAEDILNSVDCPVVTVKPPGYVSPIQAAAQTG
jgi:nucleotide-binding universal stress UspA family protein